MWVEAPRLLELEGAPEPPRSGVEADPIIISDGSGGDGPPRDARPMDEEVEASPIAKRTPWPIGLHSVEERRKKEEEEREQETRRQPQEEQQPQQKERGEGQPPAGPQLEELLEQDHQQELQELQEQQQQRGQQLEDLLKPRSHSPPQPVPPAPQEPGSGEESLPVYGPPTPAWLRPGALASIPAEPGRADGVVALACMMRTPVDPQSKIKGTIYGMDGIAPEFLRERRSWEDRIPAEEDVAGTSGGGGGSETGTWKTVDDDGRFPSLVDLFLRHEGSLETVEELI